MGLATFFQTIDTSGSRYWQMLGQYNTTTPPQTIGFSTYGGAYVDKGAPTERTVTDADIQYELARLIDEQQIATDNGRNIFMV